MALDSDSTAERAPRPPRPPSSAPSPDPHPGSSPAADAPAPAAEGELAALGEEERVVEEAARRPALGVSRRSRREGDRTFLLAALAVALLLFFGWIGGTAILGLRRDVAALAARLTAVQEGSRRSEERWSRAALRRVRADLEALGETLPPDLAGELRATLPVLDRVSERLERP